VAMIAGLFFSSGCGGPSTPTYRFVVSDGAIVPASQSTAPALPPPVLPVFIQIVKVELPLGTFSQNPGVWEILQPAAGHPNAALLAENGLQTGSAEVSAWKALIKLINKPGVSFENIFCRIAAVQPANLTVRPNVSEELISYRTPQSPLVMRTYNNCDDLFFIAAQANTDSGEALLEIQPAVNLGTVTFNRSSNEMGIVQSSEPDIETLGNLRFSATIEPGQFFVMAPDTAGHNPNTIGSVFLSRIDREPQMETVLIFIPLAANPRHH
jgi:hypothetical protein